MTSLTGAFVQYRSLQAGDEQAVLRLMRTSGYAPDEPSWQWMNRQCPQGRTLVELAVTEEGEVVGHYGVWPKTLRLKGVPVRVGMAIHAVVHPDHRGLSVLQGLMQRVLLRCREEGIPFLYAFPNDRVWLVYLKFFQWQAVGEIAAWELPLDRWTDAPAAMETTFRWVLRDPPVFGEAHGQIHRAMVQSGSFLEKVSAVKDQAWLTWRYANHPHVNYQLLEARSPAGELFGYLVLKRFEKAGVQYGHLVDFGVHPSREDCFPGLIGAALREFRNEGAAIVSSWLPEGIPMTTVLEQMGFRHTGFATHLGVRWIEPRKSGEAFMLSQWHVTMGDSDAF